MDSLSEGQAEAVTALTAGLAAGDLIAGGGLDSGGGTRSASDREGRRRVRALLRRPTFVISALIVVFWVVAALGWHLFGLDPYGNSGHSLAVPGGALGVIAGYFRGWVDTALMRVFDVLVVLPPLIFLIVLVGAFGASVPALIIIIGAVFAPGIARIVRA